MVLGSLNKDSILSTIKEQQHCCSAPRNSFGRAALGSGLHVAIAMAPTPSINALGSKVKTTFATFATFRIDSDSSAC